MSFTIYTDGSCLKNPGPGGWAAVIIDENSGEYREIHGGESSTTNNRMEILAAIRSLESVPANSEVDIFTDSQYLKKTFTEHWLENWKARNWKKSDGKPAKNVDLWKILDELVRNRRVSFHWTRGHAGDHYNERCDILARGEASKF